MNPTPIITEHDGIVVVRDDLFKGGTKARFFPVLFANADEVVYATPAQGGAQTALAHTAAKLGKRATLFVAKRAQPHNRTLEAKRVGAKIYQVAHGYLNVVQSKARRYCQDMGAYLAPFGIDMPEAIDLIAHDAQQIQFVPDEVWCASGSGVLARALKRAWPNAQVNCVQVGRELSQVEVNGATIHKHYLTYDQTSKYKTPFPSDPHYDAKAWEFCVKKNGGSKVLFWNVTGPAVP